MANTADQLFQILSHPNFLAMEGLANEVPIFIHAYPPNAENETRDMVDRLTNRLQAKGIPLARMDLFDEILAQLVAEDRLERLIEREATLGKQKMLEALRNLSDPKTRLIPQLLQTMERESAQLTLLTGVGRVFPFLRTHSLLEALQPAMTRHPIVLFFPGDYVQESEGSQLHLFGAFPNPKLSRAYYRAFNLAHYQL